MKLLGTAGGTSHRTQHDKAPESVRLRHCAPSLRLEPSAACFHRLKMTNAGMTAQDLDKGYSILLTPEDHM